MQSIAKELPHRVGNYKHGRIRTENTQWRKTAKKEERGMDNALKLLDEFESKWLIGVEFVFLFVLATSYNNTNLTHERWFL